MLETGNAIDRDTTVALDVLDDPIEDDSALRNLPRSDWVRIWMTRRAEHLPESLAREIQISLAGNCVQVCSALSVVALITASIVATILVPLDTVPGRLWLAIHIILLGLTGMGLFVLNRHRRHNTLTAAQVNTTLVLPALICGITWGGLPWVVGDSSLDNFYLATCLSVILCVIGFFWTMGHWPLSTLFASGVMATISITYLVLQRYKGLEMFVLGPMPIFALLVLSAMATRGSVYSRYYQAMARERGQFIGLIVEDYERGGHDFLWDADARLRLDHVPNRMCQASGYDPRVVSGRALIDLLEGHPEVQARINANAPFEVNVRTEGPSGIGELRLWGRPRIIMGKPMGYTGVGSDEGAVRRANEAERTSERLNALVTLTGGLAHDFNNQLATVLGAIELAAIEPSLPSRAGEHLQRAIDGCMRTRRITSDLVVASGNDANYQPEPFEIGPAVEAVVDDIRPLFASVAVELLYKGPLWIDADKNHFMRAIRNLVQNACEAVSEGPRQGTVKVSAVPTGDEQGSDRVCIRVRDDGPGVPNGFRSRIFEPFVTSRRSQGGSGLGLSLARGFARQAGGVLSLEPTTRGAAFCMELPLGLPHDSDMVEPDIILTTSEQTRLSGLFLIVEDDIDVAENLQEWILSRGGQAEIATTVAGAITGFSQRTYEMTCVISDLMLPDGQGYEVVSAFRHRVPTLRAIYISGFTPTLPSTVDPDLQCPFLSKPFTTAELVETLHHAGVTMGQSEVPVDIPSEWKV